jgi:hypothetical protein
MLSFALTDNIPTHSSALDALDSSSVVRLDGIDRIYENS